MREVFNKSILEKEKSQVKNFEQNRTEVITHYQALI